MAEEMIYSIKAQVYLLDQSTQSWMPHSKSVIPVSFFWDPNRRRTRIVALEQQEPKVNSLLAEGMSFHKPSATFGQWMDPIANQLYGLNFTSTADAEGFAQHFTDGVAGRKSVPAGVTSNLAPGVAIPAAAVGATPTASSNNSAEMKKLQTEKESLAAQLDEMTAKLRTLQAENDRMKTQLKDAQASSRSLQSDNEKLKAALVQSSSNADTWQKQITQLQNENNDLKAKLSDLAKRFQ